MPKSFEPSSKASPTRKPKSAHPGRRGLRVSARFEEDRCHSAGKEEAVAMPLSFVDFNRSLSKPATGSDIPFRQPRGRVRMPNSNGWLNNTAPTWRRTFFAWNPVPLF